MLLLDRLGVAQRHDQFRRVDILSRLERYIVCARFAKVSSSPSWGFEQSLVHLWSLDCVTSLCSECDVCSSSWCTHSLAESYSSRTISRIRRTVLAIAMPWGRVISICQTVYHDRKQGQRLGHGLVQTDDFACLQTHQVSRIYKGILTLAARRGWIGLFPGWRKIPLVQSFWNLLSNCSKCSQKSHKTLNSIQQIRTRRPKVAKRQKMTTINVLSSSVHGSGKKGLFRLNFTQYHWRKQTLLIIESYVASNNTTVVNSRLLYQKETHGTKDVLKK